LFEKLVPEKPAGEQQEIGEKKLLKACFAKQT
jgi:hypothetical protein